MRLPRQMAVVSSTEQISWRDAVRRIAWKQGQHVTLIGPTGRGKTELTAMLLPHTPYFLFFGTKRMDTTQDRLKRDLRAYTISDPAELNSEISSRFILRPPFPRNASAGEIEVIQKATFREGIMRAFNQTGWTVCLDEAKYVCHNLGLAKEATLLWMQGRSQGNAVVASVQRSRFVPLEAYDQATHLFMWTDPDLSNVRRNSELAGFSKDAVLDAMQVMDRHDVLYVNTVTEDLFITNTRWR